MLKFGGSSGPVKVRMAEAEVTVQEHGLRWWFKHGVKCPDCGDKDLLRIESQSRMGISRCANELWDTQFTTEFICGNCGCKFQGEFIEKETWQRKPLYERVQ